MRHVPENTGREAWQDLCRTGAVADVEVLDMVAIEQRRRLREEREVSDSVSCRPGDDGQQWRRKIEAAQHDEKR